MKKEKNIVSYSAEELDQMLARGESKTDWERIHNMTDEEIERNADEDSESPPYPYPTDFWQDAELVSPKEKISIRLNKMSMSGSTCVTNVIESRNSKSK